MASEKRKLTNKRPKSKIKAQITLPGKDKGEAESAQ